VQHLPPSRPQGEPGIPRTGSGLPVFTASTVATYLDAHPLAGDRLAVIVELAVMPTSQVEKLLGGDLIGTPESYPLCYVRLSGRFIFSNAPGTLATYTTGMLVFDGVTGNLLVYGGLPTPAAPGATPTPGSIPTSSPGRAPTPTPTSHVGKAPTPTPTATHCPTLQAQITSPADGATYYTNQNPITFSGTVTGACGPLTTSDMGWQAYNTTTGYVLMGYGATISYSLPAATYTIYFQVTDPNGGVHFASTHVSITVYPYIP
jgi:hypothetical protein